MVLPLLLGLGLLASGHAFAAKRKEDRENLINERYQGLLGSAPGQNMGPPEESGQLGYSGGRGLLADPLNPQTQMGYAQGVMGIPGQREYGLQLLNAAMQRGQQQQEAQRQAGQWERQFGLQQRQFDYGMTRDDRQFQAGQDARAEDARRFELTYGAGRDDAAESRRRFGLTFGLQQRAEDRQGAALDAGAGPSLPKLPIGSMWVQTADGGAMAAPIPGTKDHADAVGGLEELRNQDARIGQFLDLMAGKETRTRSGIKIRQGGTGTEVMGDNAQRLASLRGSILASVAQLRKMGVLDQKEYERLDETLPDPTGWTSLGKRSRSAEIAYETLRSELRDRLNAHLKAHPWLMPALPAGFEPEGGATPGVKPRRPGAAGYADPKAGGVE